MARLHPDAGGRDRARRHRKAREQSRRDPIRFCERKSLLDQPRAEAIACSNDRSKARSLQAARARRRHACGV